MMSLYSTVSVQLAPELQWQQYPGRKQQKFDCNFGRIAKILWSFYFIGQVFSVFQYYQICKTVIEQISSSTERIYLLVNVVVGYEPMPECSATNNGGVKVRPCRNGTFQDKVFSSEHMRKCNPDLDCAPWPGIFKILFISLSCHKIVTEQCLTRLNTVFSVTWLSHSSFVV